MTEGVQFDEPQGYSTHYPQAYEKRAKMVQYLIDKGLAKDKSQANAILVFLAIFFVVIAFFVPRFFDHPVKELKSTQPPTYAK